MRGFPSPLSGKFFHPSDQGGDLPGNTRIEKFIPRKKAQAFFRKIEWNNNI
jgi:hypothetical protein